MTAIKDLLNALHALLHNAAHIALILPLASLKALDTGLQHLIAELGKV